MGALRLARDPSFMMLPLLDAGPIETEPEFGILWAPRIVELRTLAHGLDTRLKLSAQGELNRLPDLKGVVQVAVRLFDCRGEIPRIGSGLGSAGRRVRASGAGGVTEYRDS